MGLTAAIATIGLVGGAGSIAGNLVPSDVPSPSAPPTLNQNTAESDAQKAAAKRRKLYANVGRSSTILTGPGGLGAAPAEGNNSAPKALLGL